MSKLRKFHRDETGSLVEKVALVSVVVALACVLGANMLSTMLQKGELPLIAFVQSDGHLKRMAASAPVAAANRGAPNLGGAGVDMSATASIPGGLRAAPSVSPCEKDRK